MTSPSTAPALEVTGLCAGYGPVPVLRDVSITLGPGETVTLIGANGAGKSTLLRAIMGLIRPTSGDVRFAGEPVTRAAPETLVAKGLALVPEGRMLFGPMTVEENLLLGAHVRGRHEVADRLERAYSLFPVLRGRTGQRAATLSGGEQQMLAIARALMSGPTTLLLDEPSLGLAPKVIAEIFDTLDTLRAEGLSVLLVEQDVKIALRHADRGYVMRTGSIVMQGLATDLLENEQVRHIYLGAAPGPESGDPKEPATP